jgi:hypothetical protein
MNSLINGTHYCNEFGSDCNGIHVEVDSCFGGWFGFINSELFDSKYQFVNPLLGRLGCPHGFSDQPILADTAKMWYCINDNTALCYLHTDTGYTSVSTFGGMFAKRDNGDQFVNPWTGDYTCTDDMKDYPILGDGSDDGSAKICLPPTLNDSRPSIIGGSYFVGVELEWANRWPHNVEPKLPLCPLQYTSFEMARFEVGEVGVYYICLLTTNPFFQQFQLNGI